MAKADLTAARLRELIHYDANTGTITALKDSVCGKGRVIVKDGQQLGRQNDGGYVLITVLGKAYRAHRLAWMYTHGYMPSLQIDHVNGIRSDNRLDNLRPADQSLNSQNLRVARSDSRTGMLGVVPNRKRWSAQIKVAGKTTHIGTFDTPEIAHLAYLDAKRRLHPGCTI